MRRKFDAVQVHDCGAVVLRGGPEGDAAWIEIYPSGKVELTLEFKHQGFSSTEIPSTRTRSGAKGLLAASRGKRGIAPASHSQTPRLECGSAGSKGHAARAFKSRRVWVFVSQRPFSASARRRPAGRLQKGAGRQLALLAHPLPRMPRRDATAQPRTLRRSSG